MSTYQDGWNDGLIIGSIAGLTASSKTIIRIDDRIKFPVIALRTKSVTIEKVTLITQEDN